MSAIEPDTMPVRRDASPARPPEATAAKVRDEALVGRVTATVAQRSFSLDLARLRRHRCLVPGNFTNAFAREVNVIKRSFWRVLRDRGAEVNERPTLLLVTSTKPREGKSFLSLNLALSFLFADSRRVLLVDADIRQRDLSRRLGVAEAPGLSDSLLQAGGGAGGDLDERLLCARRERLEILPAGSPAAGAGVEWNRRSCQDLVASLRRLAVPDGVVVIDTPPLLSDPVAHLLADHVDHVLLVVGARHARVDEIGLALAQLPDRSRVSLALNRTVGAQSAASYVYGQHA